MLWSVQGCKLYPHLLSQIWIVSHQCVHGRVLSNQHTAYKNFSTEQTLCKTSLYSVLVDVQSTQNTAAVLLCDIRF